ncbi:MAG: hypothetical protein HN348_36205 [Proteobacteria bacterium]|jgi:hypothetical protein|nr:hypothetical protein [Pseudomonadota bacterium]
MELAEGTIVERYIVEALIAQGGMASVFRVRHNTLGSLHAMKVLLVPTFALRQRLIDMGWNNEERKRELQWEIDAIDSDQSDEIAFLQAQTDQQCFNPYSLGRLYHRQGDLELAKQSFALIFDGSVRCAVWGQDRYLRADSQAHLAEIALAQGDEAAARLAVAAFHELWPNICADHCLRKHARQSRWRPTAVEIGYDQLDAWTLLLGGWHRRRDKIT